MQQQLVDLFGLIIMNKMACVIDQYNPGRKNTAFWQYPLTFTFYLDINLRRRK